jgi:protein phosphatase
MKSAGNNPPSGFEWAALSNIGQRRKNNEDSWGVFSLGGGKAEPLQASPVAVPEQGLLVILSDGMGGSRAGEEASRFCVDRLPVELAARAAGPGDPAGKLHDSIISTHEALVGRSKTQEAWGGMGATLSALWILPAGEMVLGHVGDSRVYALHAGEMRQLSEDHNVGASMVRRGEMSAEAATRLKFRSLLEQAMGGDGSPIVPQISQVNADAGGGFALCTDGLYGPLRDRVEPALHLAFTRPSLAAAAAELIAAANDAGGPDNITVILARLVPAPEA